MGFLSNIVGDIMGTNDAAQAASDANYMGMKEERAMFDVAQRQQREMFDLSRSDMLGERERVRTEASPWSSLGLAGYENYMGEANKGFSFDLANDPVYQERIKELDKNIASGMSAKGMKLSGSTLGALRDATATEIGSAYGRQFDKYQANLSNLFQGAGMGAQMQQGVWGVSSPMTANMATSAMTQGANSAGMSMTQGSNAAQGYQNLGAIQAQQATAPFQNLLSMGQAAGSMMMGYGML